MRGRIVLLGLGLFCILALSGDTQAGLFRRARAPACAGGTCRPTYAAPRASPCVEPTCAVAVGGGPADFMASLNSWRAANGRSPAAWDGNLAAFAATNAGVHQPGSSGGGAQTWAPTADLGSALGMWVRSPPHAAILLNATVVGASVCPSGTTCNGR